ncbi:MAG: hypothetical protein AAF211_06170 [Myxococcota bacterium]
MQRAMLFLAMAGCVSEVGLRPFDPLRADSGDALGSAEDVFLGSVGEPTDVLFVIDN